MPNQPGLQHFVIIPYILSRPALKDRLIGEVKKQISIIS